MSDSLDALSGSPSPHVHFGALVEQTNSGDLNGQLDTEGEQAVRLGQTDSPLDNEPSAGTQPALEPSLFETSALSDTVTSPGRLAFHPLANTFPLMSGHEYEAFCEDIKVNGQREPIVLHEGKILDGRNRYRALLELGIEPVVVKYDGESPLEYVLSMNMYRRQLTVAQRSMIAAEIIARRSIPAGAEVIASEGGEPNSALQGGLTTGQASTLLGISERSVSSAGRIARTGTDELRDAVKSGRVKISVAEYIAKLDEQEQREMCAAGPQEMRKKAREMREARKRKDEEAERLALLNSREPVEASPEECGTQTRWLGDDGAALGYVLTSLQAQSDPLPEKRMISSAALHADVAAYLVEVASRGISGPEEIADQIWKGIAGLDVPAHDQIKAMKFTAQVAAAIHNRLMETAIIEATSLDT